MDGDRDEYMVLLKVLEGIQASRKLKFLEQENSFLRERLQELKKKLVWYQHDQGPRTCLNCSGKGTIFPDGHKCPCCDGTGSPDTKEG